MKSQAPISPLSPKHRPTTSQPPSRETHMRTPQSSIRNQPSTIPRLSTVSDDFALDISHGGVVILWRAVHAKVVDLRFGGKAGMREREEEEGEGRKTKKKQDEKDEDEEHEISDPLGINCSLHPSTHTVQRDQSTITSLVNDTPYSRKSRGSGVSRSVGTRSSDLSVNRGGQEGCKGERSELGEHCLVAFCRWLFFV